MSTPKQKIAVLTGDLVASSDLSKGQISAAFAALETCALFAAEWHGASLNFTRHRGDGWQVVLHQPKFALRSALLFRATLKSLGTEFDTYIGMATGAAEVNLTTDLNQANDPVFVKSGQALEQIKASRETSIKLACAERGAVAATVRLADYIANDWTQAQASAISYMLPPNSDLSFTSLAKILHKSRQVVTKSLHAGGYPDLFQALEMLEDGYA